MTLSCPTCRLDFSNYGSMLNHFRNHCPATPEQRFWARVHKGERCWIWTGAKHIRGYGASAVIMGDTRAHRISWLLTRGPIPRGLGVLHKCDTPLCVNPDHLYLGDQKQNVADAVSRGRMTSGFKPLDQILHPQLSKRLRRESAHGD